eukprot:CAMPEP_0185759746 /NCGR_PEP_ID=MMETSP1174-20130828/18520_1 /TAXON_ID=35687 /ORGANISM="Dictyocha speculum, Strain CCMP1381" /LENGTH=599 /DNA_ID=CAMNT_0028440231 /DNA_START=230 /DNA_END=2029 /DNA_ORIENTATION=+
MGSSSMVCSVGTLARLVFGVSIACGLASVKLMHSATLSSFGGDFLTGSSMEDFNEGRPQESLRKQEFELSELTQQIKDLKSGRDTLLKLYESGTADLVSRIDVLESKINKKHAGKVGGDDLEQLHQQVEEDRKELERTRERLNELHDDSRDHFEDTTTSLSDMVDMINGLPATKTDVPAKQLKVHIWDDSTNYSPREDILVKEGWLEYNGKPIGDPDDSSTKPWFQLTDDPGEADLIVWATVMGRHGLEVAPMNPVKHAHKVIVLDYADGGTIHRMHKKMQNFHTELGYFKRSFIYHGKHNSFRESVTSPDSAIFPNAYSSSRAMMIALDLPQADPNHQAILGNSGSVYGKVVKMSTTDSYEDHGYFKDQRYENFLVPYRDRKWNFVNVLRYYPEGPQKDRNTVVEWSREFSQNVAGVPTTGEEFMKDMEGSAAEETADKVANGFTSYVGEIDNFCQGHCFGPNYFRLLRDAKIIVTCNPSTWEGDFRLWESFLSGALIMVDRMWVLDFMPNPPIHGEHWITYDPGNKTDFMSKIAHYTDPANIDEAEAIAKNGYEFALRNHMTVNRVEYVLNHESVRNQMMEHILDPSKREILGFPEL